MSDEYDVVVVGAGLAGLSAALTSARLGRSTAILTGGTIGGQLVSIDRIDGVPGFPEGVPGYDLCPMAQEQADAAGVSFVMATCDSLGRQGAAWRLASAEGALTARGVILATGTALARLGVPGEERLRGRGVSDCASCDAPLLRGQVAVVAGGGDSGLQEALTLAEHLSKVIVLERGAALTAQASYREQVEAHPKIEVRLGVEPVEILGEEAVSKVRVRTVPDGTETELDAAVVFAFTGLVPDTSLIGGLVPLDSAGRIQVDAALRTEAEGLCAAGNVRQGSSHRAAGAMGDGAAAAVAIDRYLATGEWRARG
jgi:thioredoxin reductase (NADPH)